MTDLNAPHGSLDIPFKVSDLSKMDVASLYYIFSLRYDITDAILQNIEKMKVQYLRGLVFDLFELLQAVKSKQTNFV